MAARVKAQSAQYIITVDKLTSYVDIDHKGRISVGRPNTTEVAGATNKFYTSFAEVQVEEIEKLVEFYQAIINVAKFNHGA